MMRFIITGLCVSTCLTSALAGEYDIIELAGTYYSSGEYHSAIRELQRYDYLYPSGQYRPDSMLLMGRAFFSGGNYDCGMLSLSRCHRQYPDTRPGEEALYLMGRMALEKGSPAAAVRTFQEYKYKYSKGRYRQESVRDSCYALALRGDMEGARGLIEKYRKSWPEGDYAEDIDRLDIMITNEMSRPRKSVLVSVLGSAVVPGFGYFYTGNTGTGFLSLFSNAALIFLIYNGLRQEDMFQVLFFSFIELSFYQYSIYGAIRSVYEYNSPDSFDRQVRLNMTRVF